MKTKDVVRFWAKCKRDDPDECWPWQGERYTRGGKNAPPRSQQYGTFMTFKNGKRKKYRAHRVAYALAVGELTRGLVICHTCDFPPCCNPKHLVQATQAENVRQCEARGRWARGSRTYSAVLTDDQAKNIRERRANGETYAALAREVGLHGDTIRKLCLGRTWKHIGGAIAPRQYAKLTPDKLAEIARMKTKGIRLKDIAKQLALGLSTVSQVSSGRYPYKTARPLSVTQRDA